MSATWCAACSMGRVRFHDGASELAPGITLHKVGGHTKGLQVVCVKTRRGDVVLASDAAHLYANMERRHPFPIVVDVDDYLAAFDTIEGLASSKAAYRARTRSAGVGALSPRETGARRHRPPRRRTERSLKAMGEHIGSSDWGAWVRACAVGCSMPGHTLTVYDVSTAAVDALTQRGATPAQNAAQVANAAELVFASLPSPGIVQDAVLGKAGAIHGTKMKIFVDLSTTGPRVATVIANALSRSNVASLDAPVSGGITGAEKGTLSVMVSGPRGQLRPDRVHPQNLRQTVLHGREAGSRPDHEACNNLMAASAMAITAEGIAMGLKAGLDPKLMIDVLTSRAGAAAPRSTNGRKPCCPRSFDFGFANALSFKDVRLCLEEAEAMAYRWW